MKFLRFSISGQKTITGALLLWLTGMGMSAGMLCSCGTTGDVVQVTHVSEQKEYNGLGEKDLVRLEEIKKARENKKADVELKNVIQSTPNYSVMEYLDKYPAADASTLDYRVGGYDVLDIIVYEEQDLSRTNVPVSADGHISFPLIGRIHVDGMTTSQIETRIGDLLAEGQFVLDAHVSVTVTDYKSRQFMVLGAVKLPGTYPLKAKERVLDAVSRAGGVDFEQGGNQAVIIRTLAPAQGREEEKIVIRIDLPGLLKGGDQVSNLILAGNDLLYIPRAENFFIIGQVNEPGSYPYLEKQITLVEAISKAGGFTQIAARNRTRIIRMVNGEEQIINVQVDAITNSGKKGQDIGILPGDVIVVPESFF